MDQSLNPAHHIVAAVADFPAGSRTIVRVGGREIGVFNVNGELFALRNVCPHRGAPLCKGRLRPRVTSNGVGSVEFAEEIELIKCPWHLWEFDLRSGVSAHDPKLHVRTYEVRRIDDQIILVTG